MSGEDKMAALEAQGDSADGEGRMTHDDMQTLAVFLFEAGMAPSQVDSRLGLGRGFARKAVVTWWILASSRGSL